MRRITKIITRTLSLRLSLRVIAALATLLLLALSVMFYFSRKAVKEEVLRNAQQTMESMIYRIDNILLSVEQASGNIYWKIFNNLHNPEKVENYTKKLVEVNPYITDCEIIWDTDSSTTDKPLAGWIDPQLVNISEEEPVGIFTLPIFDKQKKTGSMVVKVSLAQLSKIVLDAKPSPNSFCTVLRKDGTVIVHPDSSILNKDIFLLTKKDDPSMTEAALEMIDGKAGYREIKLDGESYYVFFKPFKRTAVQGRMMAEMGWSAGIIMPENDVFGDYIRLHYIVLTISFIGLLLLFLSCFIFVMRELLPLRKLEKSARHIAEGNYDETIPSSRRQDEIGRLQTHFSEMQKSLSTRVGEMQHLSDTLKERGETLQAAYEKTKAADRMKTNFLHNMSDEMMNPVSVIHKTAIAFSNKFSELTEEESTRLVDEIQHQGGKITSILNNMISESEKITN